MRLIFKFSLLSVASAIAIQIAAIEGAIAGSEPIVIPDSSTHGIDSTYTPEPPRFLTVEDIVNSSLEIIDQSLSVSSGSGPSLPISNQQVDAVRNAIASESVGGLNQALSDLRQQLSDELGGPSIDISRVGNSRAEVQEAVSASNDLINSLDDLTLAAGAESPTLVALLRLLEDANASLNSDPGLAFEDGEGEFGLIRLAPGTLQAAEPEAPEPAIEEDIQTEQRFENESEQEMRQPSPEPVRGLW